MIYSVLASGSKGNCSVIQLGETRIVIDCGSTKKHLTHSFHNIEVDYSQVDGLLITHSHSDHISQIKMFKEAAVYAPFEIESRPDMIQVTPYQSFMIKDVEILPLPLSHDSGSTVGYVITHNNEKLVYMTDTGYVRSQDYRFIEGADYYIFESNHDPELLMATFRPVYIKHRILSDNGHLCNEDSALILSRVISDNTKEIVLAHLSEEANTELLARTTLMEKLYKTHPSYSSTISIRCAKQFELLVGGLQDEKMDVYSSDSTLDLEWSTHL